MSWQQHIQVAPAICTGHACIAHAAALAYEELVPLAA